ncbi:MAG: cell division FtsA domain-containing protein [Betaproteobacteria bacterium]
MALRWRNPLFPSQRSRGEAAWLALDVGTEFVKAVLVTASPEGPVVAGTGRARQEYGDMEAGAICNIAGVTRAAAQAVDEAAESAGRPLAVAGAVTGISGAFVKGIVIQVRAERRTPGRALGWEELSQLVQVGSREAREKARRQLLQETNLSNLDIESLNAAVVEIKIDGHRVTDPLGFQGRTVDLTVFTAFAPLIHVGALRSVVRNLGLPFLAAVAEPYAVAAAALTDEACEFGTLVVDVGGGTTDIALIQKGGIAGTRMLPVGGRAFTRTIASALGIPLREAEERKLQVSRGGPASAEDERIGALLDQDLEIWRTGVGLALDDLAGAELLPGRVALCGGGSALAGLTEAMASLPALGQRPGTGSPEVVRLTAADLPWPLDPLGRLTGAQGVTPKSLALAAAQIAGVAGHEYRRRAV